MRISHKVKIVKIPKINKSLDDEVLTTIINLTFLKFIELFEITY